MEKVTGNIIDVIAKRMFYGAVMLDEGRIVTIEDKGGVRPGQSYLLPGLVDAHVHIESSMLVPDEFARAALPHGVIASVSDPHEIANVLGAAGVDYMLARAKLTPFKTLFGAPSCVPATPFESAGAEFNAADIEALLKKPGVGYLSEMMNFPGVLNQAPDVMEKLGVAKKLGLPVDGHAPGLLGEQAAAYVSAGISTDHECRTLQEAKDKMSAGMNILIREGSAAKDFEALHSLISTHTDQVMLCSDDKHPDDLLEGHIDQLVRRAIQKGHALFDVLQTAILNPIKHYGLSIGLLQPGDSFDAIEIKDIKSFEVQRVWLNGNLVVANGTSRLPKHDVDTPNNFVAKPILEESLLLPHPGTECRIIAVEDGQLWTKQSVQKVPESNGYITADLEKDILFLVVLNRYQDAPPAVSLVTGFGIKGSTETGGAIASSVAHDSHNIVAVGTSAEWLAKAINEVITHKGGLAAIDADGLESLPLPVAGLMSDQAVEQVGPAYHAITQKVNTMGSTLSSPFMTLSFMSLLVIPELKLSDKGLFDGNNFAFCELAVAEAE